MANFNTMVDKQLAVTKNWSTFDDYSDIMKELEKEDNLNEINALSESVVIRSATDIIAEVPIAKRGL